MIKVVVIIEFVASIVFLIEFNVKVVSRLHDFNFKFFKVFESFRFLSIRLFLLTTTLQYIQSQIKDDRFSNNVTKILKIVVDDIFKQVLDV